MEAIKTILSLIFKLTLIVVGLFLLFALAGYFYVEQNNKTAGNIVLCVAVGIIPLWFMRGLIWKFTKLTVFSILAIAGAGALTYGIVNVLPIAEMDLSEDNVAMGLGFFVMIVVAIVAVKILSGIGSMFSGFSGGGGGGSYSAPRPSVSLPSRRTATPKRTRSTVTPTDATETWVKAPTPSIIRKGPEKKEPQRLWELVYCHSSTPKNTHKINIYGVNSRVKTMMMLENGETGFGQWSSMNEIVSLRKR